MNPYNNLLPKLAIAPGAKTTNSTGTTIDRQEDNSFFQYVLFVINTGAITDGTHTVEVQESDDNSSWAAVADAYLDGAEPAIGSSDDNEVFVVGYKGLKRYCRVNVTVAGVTTGGIYGAVAVQAKPRHAAVTQDT